MKPAAQSASSRYRVKSSSARRHLERSHRVCKSIVDQVETRRPTGDVTRFHQAFQPEACVECTNGAPALTGTLELLQKV